MNDNDLRKDGTYHATHNLNTAIENPEVNINSATSMNIYNLDDNNYRLNQNVVSEDIRNSFDNVNFNINQNNFEDINIKLDEGQVSNNIQEFYTTNNFINLDNDTKEKSNNIFDNNIESINEKKLDNKDSYEPTLKEKKKPNSGIEVSKEAKMMILIIFILLLFVFVIPYVYDFFRELELVITSG